MIHINKQSDSVLVKWFILFYIYYNIYMIFDKRINALYYEIEYFVNALCKWMVFFDEECVSMC